MQTKNECSSLNKPGGATQAKLTGDTMLIAVDKGIWITNGVEENMINKPLLKVSHYYL